MKKRSQNIGGVKNFLTNLALLSIIFFVGTVCLYPVPEEVATENEPNVYRLADGDKNGVSLMFNVYENEKAVYAIMDTLDSYDMKATFFVGGCWADDHTKCLVDMFARGYEIGNHGYFHKDHSKLGERRNKEEILACNNFIKSVLSFSPCLFAPPSGAYSKDTLTAVNELNMAMILWSRDTIDWRDHDPSKIFTRATKNIKSGEFVLMHPTDATVSALKDVIEFYQRKGLRVVTVSENLGIGG